MIPKEVPGPFYHIDTYPRLWNWSELRDVVDAGRDITKVIRHPSFQLQYVEAFRALAEEYGSVAKYLVKERLQWDLSIPVPATAPNGSPTREYFTADIAEDLVRIIVNDWPYSGELNPRI